MIEITLSSSSILPGSDVEVSITGYAQHLTSINFHLYQLEEAEKFWQRSTDRLRTIRTETRLTATITQTNDFLPGTLYEIGQLEMFENEELVDVLQAGRDYVRIFLYVRASSEVEQTQAELRLRAQHLEDSRRVVFSRPLGQSGGALKNEYRAFSFVERCLITRRFEFPGFIVGPLSAGGDAAIAEAQFINQVLATNGWKTSIPTEDWAGQNTGNRPLVGFIFPRVIANSPEEAFALVRSVRDPLLDLFALHRGATAIPIVTVMEKNVFGPSTMGGRVLDHENGGYFTEISPYTGNVLGGFISGEEPTTLIKHARVLATDPVMALWTSLLREAETESNPNFAFFRYWNLLETISIERIKSGKSIEDFSGKPVMAGKKQANTASAHGRVYQLMQEKLKNASVAETSYTAQPGEDLWQATCVWCGFRNAAAHYGRFRPGDPVQQTQWWYPITFSAHTYVEGLEPHERGLWNPYLRHLKQAAVDCLRWELDSAAKALPSLLA